MPLQIVSNLYTTSWVCLKQKDWPWSLIAIIIFIIYVVYTIIYISKFVSFFRYIFNLNIYSPVFVSFVVLPEVFSYVPSWRINNNFKCLYRNILI